MLIKFFMDLWKGIRQKYLYWKHRNLWKYNDETPSFSLTGLRCMCKVVSVPHGDTVNVVASVCGSIQRFTIRMEGYVSPHIENSEGMEKQMAMTSMNTLATLVNGKLLELEFNNQVGEFYCGTLTNIDGLNINQEMILRRLGIPVDKKGNKKVGFIFESPRSSGSSKGR